MVHGNCQLLLVAQHATSRTEFVRILHGARFADCTKPSTWPTANEAVGSG
jgi:hypothetical protein